MMDSVASGSLAMIQPAWHHVSGSEDHRAGELYQTSLMSALMAGIYEGEATYGQIRKYGDFGLGTFNELDGEMVGFDGRFYQLRSDGSVRPVTDDQKTPFAVVTFFQPEQELEVVQPISKSEQASLDAWQDQEGKNGGGHHDMHMGKNVVVISQITGRQPVHERELLVTFVRTLGPHSLDQRLCCPNN